MSVSEITRTAMLRGRGWRKRLGEIAESMFLAKASTLGFGVAKPWGDSERYDFILDSGARLWRVQLKSAYRPTEYGGYNVSACGNSRQAYSKHDLDVLVAYVVPVNGWYVVPLQAFARSTRMKFFPESRRRMSNFERFRERWCWMACRKSSAEHLLVSVPHGCQPESPRQSGSAPCPLSDLTSAQL
ncbi:MAG: hypothetical protein H0X25_01465 [Acidobacteriales bacterium]|nr:hypothetical protein [Terriglobales bacterium]